MERSEFIEQCCFCGSEMKIKNINGFKMPYKQHKAVTLSADFDALACTNCDEFLLRGRQVDALDEALELSIKLQHQDKV